MILHYYYGFIIIGHDDDDNINIIIIIWFQFYVGLLDRTDGKSRSRLGVDSRSSVLIELKEESS